MIALGRFLRGLGLALLLILGAVALPFILAANRASYAEAAESEASCLLGALTGGPKRVTFSAWSWDLLLQGKRGAALRVQLVDALPFNGPGHCCSAWMSHVERGLLPARP